MNQPHSQVDRRALLGLMSAGCANAWLTPLANALARDEEQSPRGRPAKSVIVLWLYGAPSQLETFDPHPAGSTGGVASIKTAVPGVEIAKFFPQLAEQMAEVSLIRSLVSKEGDHERATYNMKTGYRPDPTLVHPSLGAVLCHQLTDAVDIPRHVSLLFTPWPARGGYLGDQFDAFKANNLNGQLADVRPSVDDSRFRRRLSDLENVVEAEFARGRLPNLDEKRTLHRTLVKQADRMMSSEQLKAFDVTQTPQALRDEFGDTDFGRGCLVAARLIRAGVRCVEVSLGNWDSHLNNHDVHERLAKSLDPAFAALLRHLKAEGLLDSTVVMCGGEFGRTPQINPANGRDHWPHGFSMALAGGGIAGGQVIGETSPEPKLDKKSGEENVTSPVSIANLHATIMSAVGIDSRKQLNTPIGRPLRLTDEGTPIRELLRS